MNSAAWRYHTTSNASHPVVILSGSLGTTQGIASYLAEQLNGYRLIVPEYSPVKTVEECVRAVNSILDREQIERSAILGGSFGGLIAQAFVRHHPERITHLILSGTSPPNPGRVRANIRALKIQPFVPLRFTRTLLRTVLHIMLLRVKNPIWVREYSNLISRLSKADIVSRYQVAIDFDRNYSFASADLPSSLPVLILEGEKDRIATRLVRDQLREIYPNAQFHVFLGAGHSSIMTHTNEWVNVVNQFLKGRTQNTDRPYTP